MAVMVAIEVAEAMVGEEVVALEVAAVMAEAVIVPQLVLEVPELLLRAMQQSALQRQLAVVSVLSQVLQLGLE